MPDDMDDLLLEEDAPKKKKKENDAAFYAVFFLLSTIALTVLMYFIVTKKIEEREQARIEQEQMIADSLAALSDTLNPKDSIPEVDQLVEVPEEEAPIEIDSTRIKREERVKKVAKIISSMDSEAAGNVLATLDEDLAAEIILYMQTRSSGEVLSNVSPAKTSQLSKKMVESD